MTRITRLLTALSLLAVLSACTPLSVESTALSVERGGEEPFEDEKLAFIEIGKSTKEDIAAAMPGPMQFLDGKTWLFARTRKEAQSSYVSTYQDTKSGQKVEIAIGDVDFRYLVIRFDDNGVVSGYEASKSEYMTGCNRSGVCNLAGSTYMLLAPETEDLAAKQLDQPANSCGVYMYGNPSDAVEAMLDRRPIGGIFDKNYYIFQQTRPGQRQLIVSLLHEGPADLNASIDFNCDAGSSVFIEVKMRSCKLLEHCGRFTTVAVSEKEASDGRQAIADRDLILPADDLAE